ncbi:hypothetical protein CN171_35510 [Sinorhizobium meliloti]|nr:hypothetical protein [Sinorhizobium meliloti]RVJ62416.1 hypothetical protein CN171_35510 [Sinorhizobium meliloti]
MGPQVTPRNLKVLQAAVFAGCLPSKSSPDIRTWDGGIRRFLVDEQCDPDVVERVMADEMKRGL